MNKILGTAAFVIALLVTVSARAAVIITSVTGSSVSPTFEGGPVGSTYITFDDVAGPYPSGSPFVSNGFTFTGGGAVVIGSVGGAYASPAGDTTNYLTTGFNGAGGLVTETVKVGAHTEFGLYWGSIDQYNTISFLSNGVTVASFGGCTIAPSVCNGDQSADTTNRYVNFDFTTGSFDTVVFQSTSPAFEVDNLAVAGAVPELSTWAMMLTGFAGIGFAAHRRTKKSSAVAAI